MLRLCLSTLVLVMLCSANAPRTRAQDTLDLSGQWQLRLDAEDQGMRQQWFAKPLDAPTSIALPNTTDLAGLGHPLDLKNLQYAVPYPTTTRFPGVAEPRHVDEQGYLVRKNLFVGPAWYERTVTLPATWHRHPVTLRLERAMWETTVWVDGQPKGSCDSLVAQHCYQLGELKGATHRITIRVDNRMLWNISTITHAYGPETQSRWNGIVGRIELERHPRLSIRQLATYPAADRRSVRARLKLANQLEGDRQVQVRLRLTSEHSEQLIAESLTPISVREGTSYQEVTLQLSDAAKPWDEFHPQRYELTAELLDADGRIKSRLATLFGFRHIATVGNEIRLNGQRIFLRGTLDCCVYPRTGHPPMSLNEWKRILGAIKQYGFNHVRFHTWCPPAAAFAAADQLGLYLMVETPAWIDDWGVKTVTRPRGIGDDEDVIAYLRREMHRISEAYGNHPSFVMFTIGNEFGMTQTDWDRVAAMVKEIKESDPRRLYSGCCARRCLDVDDYWVTHRTTVATRGIGPAHTDWDFGEAVAGSAKPVICHETGQRPVFPDYQRLLPKFTGPLLPLNYARHRRTLQQNGLIAQTHDFVRASARFQYEQYKSEHEAMRRTDGLAGYQLLMLSDFTGQSEALVGIVDPFWESKGIVSQSEVRRWNGPTALLARFPKYAWTNEEKFTASISVAHFAPTDIQSEFTWTLKSADGAIVGHDTDANFKVPTGGESPLSTISVPLDTLQQPTLLTLHAALDRIENEWKFLVVPAESPAVQPRDIIIARNLDTSTVHALTAGGTVVWLAHGFENAYASRTGFASVYWSAGWWGNPFSTLGIVCGADHPVFRQFPNHGYSDWQWYALGQGATTLRLSGAPHGYRPLIQGVPDFHFCELLAQLFEARVGRGRLLACGYDLTSDLQNRPAARQFRKSLFEYVASSDFAPQQEISPQWLAERFGADARQQDEGP